ncbi:hypothetical protein TSOC_012353 [Tetrabaena socialis]|uniref:Uncharacterized protein n=1 Tax=Tetrabaena socialis TaxID=47790 RepID=A0A2J7ZNA5_9CHLO|nr:hypothetical protein TSOC_012353 [Tetrabaena socialis]|eukprot:PNH01737.1 hypothetical protein TSOC_012353 [Tetrabaena socialis]
MRAPSSYATPRLLGYLLRHILPALSPRMLAEPMRAAAKRVALSEAPMRRWISRSESIWPYVASYRLQLSAV